MNKYFAGGNTPFGFVSYFENIFDYARGGKLYILKGGSGVGKSTFMKEFSKLLTDRGNDIDYYYCSGDSESLDGIFCKKLNIGM
ncbi:MAG: ATPase, partial [Clostridia bacterium]